MIDKIEDCECFGNMTKEEIIFFELKCVCDEK